MVAIAACYVYRQQVSSPEFYFRFIYTTKARPQFVEEFGGVALYPDGEAPAAARGQRGVTADENRFSRLPTEKQRDVQRAGGGERRLGPDERGGVPVADGHHHGAPGGGGGLRGRGERRGKRRRFSVGLKRSRESHAPPPVNTWVFLRFRFISGCISTCVHRSNQGNQKKRQR